MFWLTGGDALPQWPETPQGRKPGLFFAPVTVDGDTGQLMDGEVSELKVGLTCKEQKVLATHKSPVRGQRASSVMLEVEIYCEALISLCYYEPLRVNFTSKGCYKQCFLLIMDKMTKCDVREVMVINATQLCSFSQLYGALWHLTAHCFGFTAL